MRTDVTVDRQFVSCPNASTLAYGKWRAQVGDWVIWRSLTDYGIGRMIGRIHYAPPLGETPAIHNWIEVLMLGERAAHAGIRWIDPADVFEVHPATPDIGRFLSWFAGPLPDRDTVIRMVEYGALSANQQVDYPQWDFAEKINGYYAMRDRIAQARKDRS